MQSRYKVLVVEDEGLIARDITNRLEALGHEVIAVADTGEEAVERAAGAEVVLMDIRLDGPMDGIEAASRIRERYHLPVIFLTAHADRATLERAKLTGPFGYIVKPLAAASLHTSLEIAVYKHRMERQLEEREAWLRITLESVADAVIVTDAGGSIRMLNRAAEILIEWTQSDAQGHPITRILAEDPVPLAILGDAPFALNRDVKVLTRAGRPLVAEGSVAPVKASGTAIGAVITLRDVSVRRWENEQILQAQKMEAATRLAAGVSGEFTNLLAILRTQAGQLLNQFADYAAVRRPVEEIQHAVAAAEQITRRLAGFSARKVARLEVLSVNGVLRRMSKLIEAVAGDRIGVAIRPEPVTGRVKADPSQIEHMIMNLVLHSCGAMPEGGQLLIESGNADVASSGQLNSGLKTGYVLLAVTHSGVEPEFEKLFEPKSAADEDLGLSTAHNIATEHDGFLSARLTEEGCRFEALLPRWSEAKPEAQPEGPGESPAIVLVESRERVRAQLHNFFEANGYNLLEAADTGEAAALCQVHEGTLDLLIADAAAADALGDAVLGTDVLRVTDGPEKYPYEIRRPFTQAALLERVVALLADRRTPDVAEPAPADLN